MLKVVTIGGGSSYTPELVEGFIKRYDKLPIDELWLVDIEEGKEKLKIVGNLAKRMVEKANIPMKIILTLDRKEALKNANFVTTQFRVGLQDVRVLDERIPLSKGIIGQETNGAGGFFKALRTIPVIEDIVNDIRKYCDGAWFINFTNPAGMVTEAIINKFKYERAVGLCNVPLGLLQAISKMLNVKEEEVTLSIIGLNHHSFVTDVFVNGESKMDYVIEKYCNLSADEQANVKNIITIPWSKELIKGIRAIPGPYFSYYVHTKEQLLHELDEYNNNNVRAEFVKNVEKELFEIYKDINLKEKPKQLELRGGARYSDAACSLISSIYNDEGDIQYVNCKNGEAVTNLDSEYIIETAAIITKEGPKPIKYGKCPYLIKGSIENIKSFELAAIDAALTGNRDIAIAALAMNPLIDSENTAIEVFDELYKVHRKYLPRFNL